MSSRRSKLEHMTLRIEVPKRDRIYEIARILPYETVTSLLRKWVSDGLERTETQIGRDNAYRKDEPE